MGKTEILKKEKGTINSTLNQDSVKNQVKDKPIILNRNEIQNLLSNSINFLDNKIVNQKNRIGSILLNEKEKIESSLIKYTNNYE